jgi:arginine decarboxylase
MERFQKRRLCDEPADVERPGLCIAVVAGVGQGQTALSAFDAALWRCGVHSYNLLALSSVIPPGSQINVCDRYQAPAAENGHKLYVVKAEMRSDEPGAVIAAGLGWLQRDDGRGVFVEHEVSGEGVSPAELEGVLSTQIATSLRDLAHTRGLELDSDQARKHVVSTIVESLPACALVLAVYQAEGWSDARPVTAGGR